MLKIKDIFRFIKYALSGALATAPELLILYWLTDKLGAWYVYSSILAYGFGFTISFFLRKFWAFKDYSFKKIWHQFLVYITVLGTSLFLNTVLIIFLVEKLNLFYLLAQFVAGVFIGWLGYLINERITFKVKIRG
jgi:dolichol-phosphate mannosyltransferase